jgi:hypothetical protein
MIEMRRMTSTVVTIVMLLSVCLAGVALTAPTRLSHRLWALPGLPPQSELDVYRAAGFDEVVVPVGRAELDGGKVRLSLMPLPEAGRLVGWKVTALVMVHASGKATGDAAAFASQVTPVLGTLKSGGILLAATGWAEGIPGFASALASKLGRTVELAMPVGDLAAHLPAGGWKGVQSVAVGLGNPGSLGFPNSTFQDDLTAIDALAGRLCPYRVAIPLASRVTPAPGASGVSLAAIAVAGVATYRPGARGDDLELVKAVDWGGVPLAAGQTIELELMDTARYHRDLTALLRPARPGFEGVDTIGFPPPEPTLGLSRQAFLDYLGGGGPSPATRVEVSWAGTVARIDLVNPGPHASAMATTGNWVEIQATGAQIGDVSLGAFSGVEYGRWERGVFKRTNAREAAVLRFYVTYLAPYGRISGGSVAFLGRPQSVQVRTSIRLGDGSDVTGSWQPLR